MLHELLLLPLMLFSIAFARDRQVAREDEMTRECCVDPALQPPVGWAVTQTASPCRVRLFVHRDPSLPARIPRRFEIVEPSGEPLLIAPAGARIRFAMPQQRRR